MEGMTRAAANALDAARVPYVVIGGIAASIWGRPRATMDLDAVVVASPEKMPALLDALGRAGFRISRATARRLAKGFAAKLTYGRGLSLDLRVATYSIDRQALERAVGVRLFGVRLPVASKEDTIAYKVARFDDIDRADIKAILLRWGQKLDTGYLDRTSRQLALESGRTKVTENLANVLQWRG